MQITRNGLKFTVVPETMLIVSSFIDSELESIPCDLHFDLVFTADVYLNRFWLIRGFEIIDFESLDDLNRFRRWLSIWIDFYGGSWFESISVLSKIWFDFQCWCWFESIRFIRGFESISAVDLHWHEFEAFSAYDRNDLPVTFGTFEWSLIVLANWRMDRCLHSISLDHPIRCCSTRCRRGISCLFVVCEVKAFPKLKWQRLFASGTLIYCCCKRDIGPPHIDIRFYTFVVILMEEVLAVNPLI